MFSPKNTDCVVCPASVFLCCFISVCLVLFSLFSFVLRSLAILLASMVLDIVEGQRRGGGQKNGQKENIEKIRGPKKEGTDFGQSRFGHPDLTNFGQSIWIRVCVSWWGSNCGTPKGGAARSVGGPKFRAFFPSPAPIFALFCLSLGVFSWNFGRPPEREKERKLWREREKTKFRAVRRRAVCWREGEGPNQQQQNNTTTQEQHNNNPTTHTQHTTQHKNGSAKIGWPNGLAKNGLAKNGLAQIGLAKVGHNPPKWPKFNVGQNRTSSNMPGGFKGAERSPPPSLSSPQAPFPEESCTQVS